MLGLEYLLRDHQFTCQQRNTLLSKVTISHYYSYVSQAKFHSLFVVLVIVTEKTNILLRYLHQQWERKVLQY